MEVVSDENSEIVSAWVNDKEIAPDEKRLELRYFDIPKEGIELVLTVKGSGPLGLRVADYVNGLAESTGIAMQDRPADLMPTWRMSWIQNTSAVSRSYSF